MGEYNNNAKKSILSVIFILSLTIISISFVAAQTNCYQVGSQSSCESNTDCLWVEDEWGSWCEEKGCWNFNTDSLCSNSSTTINTTCTWNSGTSSWCMDVNCWSFDGTNQSACESNSQGLTCDWFTGCTGPGSLECWDLGNQTSCEEVVGCEWGICEEQSCWDYTSQSSCEENVGVQGNDCKWDTQYSNCYESYCWDYTNSTDCTGNSCIWNSGYCSEPYCGDFSFTNATACVNNTVSGLTCEYTNNFCNPIGCWNNFDESSCGADTNCFWEQSDTGWCEETHCWSFDNTSWGLGVGLANESACVNNTAGLNCIWGGDGGWCYENVTSKTCGDKTNVKDCIDTFYCQWNGSSSTCQDPNTELFDFSSWNPGCYIFDSDESSCLNTTGCYYNNNACEQNTSVMATNELNCTLVSGSSLCNSIPVLGTCCTWQGDSCVADSFSQTCRDQLQEPPAGASFCEDYNAYTDSSLCQQISASPWFMPCSWNNVSERCEVKHEDLFDDGKENLLFIDNAQNCEYAGGKWVTESYCSGDFAIPTGHCEFKFDDETNCDKACYACEHKSDATNWTTSAEARAACVGSALGICEYQESSGADNGLGICDIKDEFKTGIATGTCDTSCSTCTYMGDSISDVPENRPSYFCSNSEADCKWLPDLVDSTDESKGRCAAASEKSCDDKCDKCYEQFLCTSYGAKNGDSSLAAQCTWDSSTDVCKPTTGAGQLEVCWDGIDNNNDNKIDCADSMCFTDPFCGGGFFNDSLNCFSFSDSSSCSTGGCDWVNNDWGSWCDYPGANCWENDGTNQTFCEAAGCEWHGGGGGFCEDDWDAAGTCFTLNQTTCQGAVGIAANCTWGQDDWCQEVGGWCENNPSYTGAWVDCYSLYNQWDNEDPTGCAADAACQWHEDSWCATQGVNAGWCDHKQYSCWNYDSNYTGCIENNDWCVWENSSQGGWCNSKNENFDGADSCWNQADETACGAVGCNWISGLCDPPGFGSHSGTSNGTAITGSGLSCFVNDGNQTACESTTGCGWFDEPNPFCDVNFGSECHQLSYNQTLCGANDRCAWDANQNFCDEKAFTCFSNSSLQTEGACDAHPQCAWNVGGFCESTCFGQASQSACGAVNVTNGDGTDSGTTLCTWLGGWCSGAMSVGYFKDMEPGAPIPLGVDDSGDGTHSETDILGYGLKDLGDAFGFGMQVSDLTNASLCNGIKMASGSGVGTNQVTAYYYLDTDGAETGSCEAIHDSSKKGFEFYVAYTSSFNPTTSSVNEKFSAYRCSSSSFIVTDIKVNGFRQKMCTEIGGPMVAVDKADLEKFPSLYTTGADMRVLVAITNGTNASTVLDTTGIGYATPGAIDFDLDSLDFNIYKSNGSGNYGQDKASKGYVEYEADCWTATGCADYSCLDHPYCVNNNLGVHASSFTDTRTPKVTAINKEVYPDAALISYYTDKPANGTLEYYGTDSTCSTTATIIKDRGLISSNIQTYRLVHEAELYNDGGVNSLSSALSADTKYYYKLKICDENGKCGISKCSDFVTDNTVDCGLCNFVTRLDVPTGWNVKYDLDTDDTFEHVQGQVCGVNSGMQTNYTTGRQANIRLYKTDNTTYLDFVNVKLTKSALSSNIKDVDADSDFAAGTTDTDVGYVGLISSTRDKIINNLHPENCTIKIPGDGTCTELYHCDDDLGTCLDRTSEATLLDTGSDYCEWQIPYCQFSVWAGGDASASSSSGGSSGGSGGGGSGGSGGAAGGSGGGGFGARTADSGDQNAEVLGLPEVPTEQLQQPAADDEQGGLGEGLADVTGMAVTGLDYLSNALWFWVLFGALFIVIIVVGIVSHHHHK